MPVRSPFRKVRKSAKKTQREGKNKSKSKSICRTLLSEKIRINMGEYKKGRYVSPAQAIAVAYQQVQTKRPGCKKSLKRKNKSTKK